MLFLRKEGTAERRLKKLRWAFGAPRWVDCCGVRLPVKHPAIPPVIAKELYFCRYERQEFHIVSRKLTRDDVIMEAGAGIGFLSAYCAKIVGSDRVFAYEANPELMPLIAEVYRANQVAPSVSNAMLSDSEGEADFNIEPIFWSSSALSASRDSRVVRVRRVNLNEEITRVQPTFLIVDIEGGEHEFFRNANLAGVRKICVELHPHLIGGERVAETIVCILQAGFALDLGLVMEGAAYFERIS